jgi:threonine aldolase
MWSGLFPEKGQINQTYVDEMIKIKEVCQNNNMALHLDGARLFNALIEKKQSPKVFGQLFDTISICLSKGLGAPVGSLLIGSKEHITKATRIRKVMGGGMRQAGFLAAAGLFALQNNIERITVDHLNAKKLEACLRTCYFVENIYSVETNIIIFKLNPEIISANQFIDFLKQNGILAVNMGNNLVRFVLHLDISESGLNFVINILNELNFKRTIL